MNVGFGDNNNKKSALHVRFAWNLWVFFFWSHSPIANKIFTQSWAAIDRRKTQVNEFTIELTLKTVEYKHYNKCIL